MSSFTGIGTPVRRKEDRPHLTGTACFTADLHRPDEVHAAVVRSPHAHARLGRIDTAAARTLPGVLLVLTAEDVRDEIAHALPSYSRTPPFDVRGRDGAPAPEAEQFPLARERVRYPGEAVAFVVAETPAQAQDAAELVTVEYRPLPAVVDLEQALAPDAPRLWDDVPGNVSIDWEHGDAEAVEAALARAAHVARVTVANNRLAVAFMEPRAALAEFDSGTGRWTLWAGCQSAHRIQELMAYLLGVDIGRVRVVVPHMGGGFGARAGNYPEFPLLIVAARRLGRPVRWTAERTESFLTDTQARDHILRGSWAWTSEAASPRSGSTPTGGTGLTSRPAASGPWSTISPRRWGGLPHPLWPPQPARCVHEHHPGGSLPRHRPGRGQLHRGEPGRRGRARHRDRSARAQATQPGGGRRSSPGPRREARS